MSAEERPFRRNTSRTVEVPGKLGTKAVVVEIRTEEWLNQKTGRYRRVWSARRKGALAWDAASTARSAIASATFLPSGRRPTWLPIAVAEAERKLGKDA